MPPLSSSNCLTRPSSSNFLSSVCYTCTFPDSIPTSHDQTLLVVKDSSLTPLLWIRSVLLEVTLRRRHCSIIWISFYVSTQLSKDILIWGVDFTLTNGHCSSPFVLLYMTPHLIDFTDFFNPMLSSLALVSSILPLCSTSSNTQSLLKFGFLRY